MATKNKTKKKRKSRNKQNKKVILSLSAAFFIIIIGVLVAVFSLNGSRELANIDKQVANGIDVSYHNGKIDWSKVKKEVDFAFIRVGYRGYDEGLIHLDSKAQYNLKNANKNNVPVGVYFYSQAINDKEAEEEAEYLISKIKKYDISLPVVIDFEYPYVNGEPVGRLVEADLSRKERTSLINAFCRRIKKAGYTSGVYASSYIFRGHLNMSKLDDDIMIWVADYNEKVTYKGEYDFWQYSEKGKCKGVSSKYVDKNYWYIEKEESD